MPKKMVAMRLDPVLLARFDDGLTRRNEAAGPPHKTRTEVIESMMDRQATAWEQNTDVAARVAARRDPAR